MIWKRVPLLIAVLVPCLLVAILVLGLGVEIRYYLNLATGEVRQSTYLFNVEMMREVEALRLPELFEEGIGGPDEWLIDSSWSLRQRISPHYRFHGIIHDAKILIRDLDSELVTEESRRTRVREFLDRWIKRHAPPASPRLRDSA